MSETPDIPRSLQQQIQQRQILTMMGVKQWVQSDSPTIDIAELIAASATRTEPILDEGQDVEKKTDSNAFNQPTTDFDDQDSLVQNYRLKNKNDSNIVSVIIPTTATTNDSTVHDAVQNAVQTIPSASSNDDDKIAETHDDRVNEPANDHSNGHANEREQISADKIAPFDLQGGRYKDWVLLVDIQALSQDSQKLWQNIVQALSLELETGSFPICEGMDTSELANASFAGYIFRIGRTEQVKVAALTELPEGLIHPNIKSVPSLDKMLADSTQKRELWQQLAN